MQGSWVEVKGKGKTWMVEEDVAYLCQEHGGRKKRFPLTKGADGEVIWGQGKYILDWSFKASDDVATWWDGDAVGFSWKRLPADTVGEKSSTHIEGEKRVDPCDGKAYTLDEMRTYYSEAEGTPKIETTAYWLECKPAVGAAKAKAKAKAKATSEEVEERRIDASDGSAYTYSEMRSFYSASYTKKQMESYWAECKVAKPKAKKVKSKSEAAAGEQRTDEASGKSYTWEELRSLYSDTHTKKETSEYWEQCEPAGKGRGKSKAKAKSKPKAKPKSKAEADSQDWMQ